MGRRALPAIVRAREGRGPLNPLFEILELPTDTVEFSILVSALLAVFVVGVATFVVGTVLMMPKVRHRWWEGLIPGYNLYVLFCGARCQVLLAAYIVDASFVYGFFIQPEPEVQEMLWWPVIVGVVMIQWLSLCLAQRMHLNWAWQVLAFVAPSFAWCLIGILPRRVDPDCYPWAVRPFIRLEHGIWEHPWEYARANPRAELAEEELAEGEGPDEGEGFAEDGYPSDELDGEGEYPDELADGPAESEGADGPDGDPDADGFDDGAAAEDFDEEDESPYGGADDGPDGDPDADGFDDGAADGDFDEGIESSPYGVDDELADDDYAEPEAERGEKDGRPPTARERARAYERHVDEPKGFDEDDWSDEFDDEDDWSDDRPTRVIERPRAAEAERGEGAAGAAEDEGPSGEGLEGRADDGSARFDQFADGGSPEDRVAMDARSVEGSQMGNSEGETPIEGPTMTKHDSRNERHPEAEEPEAPRTSSGPEAVPAEDRYEDERPYEGAGFDPAGDEAVERADEREPRDFSRHIERILDEEARLFDRRPRASMAHGRPDDDLSDLVEGQIEGIYAEQIGYPEVTQAVDAEEAAYLEENAAYARERVLEETHDRPNAHGYAAKHLASAAREVEEEGATDPDWPEPASPKGAHASREASAATGPRHRREAPVDAPSPEDSHPAPDTGRPSRGHRIDRRLPDID